MDNRVVQRGFDMASMALASNDLGFWHPAVGRQLPAVAEGLLDRRPRRTRGVGAIAPVSAWAGAIASAGVIMGCC